MGRYVRTVLRGLLELGADLFFVVRPSDRDEVRSEFDLPLVSPGALRARRHDVVWYAWNGVRFRPHAPGVATIYDPFAFSFAHRNPIARAREQWPIRRAIREAAAIATISRWSADELRLRFAQTSGRLTVVSPAVDRFWHPVETMAREPYVLVLAGPDRRKNIAFFARVFERAFPAESGVRLVVAGALQPQDAGAVATLGDRATAVCPSDEQLRALYSGATAVAVPSVAEGHGLPAVEAMACGAPVLAADATALPEACDGAALLVPASDPAAWREALHRVTADATLRADLRDRGLRRAARIDPIEPARLMLELFRRASPRRSAESFR